MNVLLFVTTVLLVGVFVFPLIRLVALKCGIIPPIHEFPSQPAHTPVLPECDAGYEAPASGRSGFRYTLSSVAGLIFLYCIGTGRFSIDTPHPASEPTPNTSPIRASESHGLDWKIVDGVRWFHVAGTDSAGIGYTGWISELFLRVEPPESSSDTPGIMEKISLPSMKEKLEGTRQLRKIGKALEQALSKD